MKRLHYLSAISILVSTGAWAVPTAFPQRPHELLKVKNNTDSTLLGDTEDPSMVWVMPPTAGTTTPSQFRSSNANLGFCREMADLQSASRELAKDIKKYTERSMDAESEVKAKQDAYYRARAEAEMLKTNNSQLSKLVEMQTEVETLDQRIDQLRTELDQCKDANSPACRVLDKQIADALVERRKLAQEIAELRRSTQEDLRKYTRLTARAEVLKEEWNDALGVLSKIRGFLVESRSMVIAMYRDLGKLEGGYAQLGYSSGWDENLDRLRKVNSSYQFKKIPTQNVRVNAGFVSGGTADSYLSSLPAILDYSLNGKGYVPYGVNDPQDLAALPNQMSASFRLSLVGACPLVNAGIFDIPKDSAGVPVFGTSASYNYTVAFSSKVKFSYNLYKFYQLIQKSGSSGGLFHSSSWSETSEKKVDKSAFEADWKESDPDHQTPDVEKRKIEAQIKAELMERVLKQMATPIYDGKIAQNTPPIPERGAIVLANGLQATCGWYSYYCTGGAWLLRGLDSIFGNSRSESDFQKTYDSWATETWNSQDVRLKPGVMTFPGA